MSTTIAVLIDNRGLNIIEYKRVGTTIFAISSMPMTEEQMKKIEQNVGLERHLGKACIDNDIFVEEDKYILLWTVVDASDCDWS